MTDDLSKVSVVIPVRNQALALHQCLAALQQQTFPFENTEIIVVDNGSEEDVEAIAQEFGANYLLREETANPYYARNEGLRNASYSSLVLLDAKCLPCPEFIEAGLKLLQQNSTALVAGNIQFSFSAEKTVHEMADCVAFFPNHRAVELGFGVPTGALFFSKSSLLEIGFFLENIRSGADIEWSLRFREMGLGIAYAEAAKVFYRANPKERFWRKAYGMGKGYRAITLAKHHRLTVAFWRFAVLQIFPPRPFKLKRRIAEDYRDEKMNRYFWRIWFLLWQMKGVQLAGMLKIKLPFIKDY